MELLEASREGPKTADLAQAKPNLPTKIVPAKIPRLNISGKSPMGLRIPPLKIKILLESKTSESRILVQRLDATRPCGSPISDFRPVGCAASNSEQPAKNLDFRGSDSRISFLILRDGIPRSAGDSPDIYDYSEIRSLRILSLRIGRMLLLCHS